jgi:hypothetical protein
LPFKSALLQALTAGLPACFDSVQAFTETLPARFKCCLYFPESLQSGIETAYALSETFLYLFDGTEACPEGQQACPAG